MKRKFPFTKRKWLLSASIMLLSCSAMAQTEPLTLKAALQYAQAHYVKIRKARLEVENSEYKIQQTRAQALPQISGNGSLTYNPLLQLSALPAELSPTGTATLIAFGQKWNSSFGLSLNQTLFDKSVFTGLKAAEAARAYYALAQQQTEEQVLQQVATAYYQLLVQKQKVIVADTNIQTTTAMQTVIQGQYNSGLAKRIDLDRVTVNLNNLLSQRRQQQTDLNTKENQLKFYMGMPLQTPVAIAMTELTQLQPQAVATDDSVNVLTRSDYLVLKKQEDLLKLQKASVAAAYYPTLALQSNYSYQRYSNAFPFSKVTASNPKWFDVASIGVNLKVPLFTGGATRAKVKQAEIDIKKLQEDIVDLSLSLQLSFENARNQVNNSILTINSQQSNRKLALSVFTDTQSNYNLGLANLTDLLDARNQLTDADNNYTNALLDYKLAEIQLITSKGQIQNLLK